MYRKSGPWMAATFVAFAAAQSGLPPPPQQPPSPVAPAPRQVAETVTKEEPATFKARVNLVLVPVVVRDQLGRAVRDLKKEDFELLDRGKPQLISRFSIERTVVRSAEPELPPPGSTDPAREAPAGPPERFIGYLFDDMHLNFGDLSFARSAALRHIKTSLQPADRAAVFTTSGQTVIDFTDDRGKLEETLMRIQPRPIAGSHLADCPPLNYYMADLIQNHNDSIALATATRETQVCAQIQEATAAESMARAAAARMVAIGFQETHVSLGVIRDVVRRMASAPGQRVVLLVSPGFLVPEHRSEETEIMDRAIKANVMISAIDARGLYTDPALDVQQRVYDLSATSVRQMYDRQAATAQSDVLAELAAGTGGTFFQNSNDLGEGYSRLAAAPAYLYVLGFSPQNLKLDGSFHALKVSVRDVKGLTLQARRGYYAPRRLNDAEETAREEIREAVFSREELHELSAEMRSQFFKPSDDTAKVTVLVRLALRNLKFRKVEDRNDNKLTVVSALFDRNGNYVVGNQKTVEMRLKDETLHERLDAGFTLRSTFDVKPGTYLIRLVVRDTEGQMMAAQNGSVDIP